MRARLIATGVIGTVVIVAIVVWATAGPDRSGQGAPPPPRSVSRLNRAQELKLKEAALRSPVVRGLTKGHKTSVIDVVPWINEATGQSPDRLLGGDVKIDVSPAIELKNEVVPVYIIPGRSAPPRTPALNRYARYSATHVSQLRTLVNLETAKVMEVAFSGDRLKIMELKLLGPDPGPAYRGDPGE